MIFGGLLGGASFIVTGPLTAALLLSTSAGRRFRLFAFLGLYYAIGAPTLAYQAIEQPTSLLGSYILGRPVVTYGPDTGLMMTTAFVGIAAYAAFAGLTRS
jgi:hypothetical protein